MSLSGFDRYAENVFKHYPQIEPMGETHGHEALRRLISEVRAFGTGLHVHAVQQARQAKKKSGSTCRSALAAVSVVACLNWLCSVLQATLWRSHVDFGCSSQPR